MSDGAPGGDPTPTGPAIRFAGVGKRIGDATLLAGLDFEIPHNQRLALIGPSGAGKTTLLRLVAGVLWPTSGTVTVLDRETGSLSGKALCDLRRQVGFLYQQENLVPGLRVAHNVLMGRLGEWSIWRALWSLIRPQQVGVAHAALERVELGDRLWAMPGELSGGEQQRVAIARLLVQQPHILLADEPVASLDIRLGRDVVKLLLAATEHACTKIVSLHSLDLLGEKFDRVLALREGRIVFDGPTTALTREILQQVYGAEYRALHLDEVEIGG